MTSRRVAASVGILTATAIVVAVGATGASATKAPLTLNFTNKMDTFAPIDVPPTGPSAGDQFLISSHVVAGGSGRTAATCQLITLSRGGIRLCEIDFMLSGGTITTRGTTDTAATPTHLVVTGGSGKYVGAQGSGTLTPTATGSVVTLSLH